MLTKWGPLRTHDNRIGVSGQQMSGISIIDLFDYSVPTVHVYVAGFFGAVIPYAILDLGRTNDYHK